MLLREGFKKKKIVEFSTKGEGGLVTGDFPLRKEKKNMGLRYWILPNNHFKTHLFFQFLGGGDPFHLGSWSEGWLKLQSSLRWNR